MSEHDKNQVDQSESKDEITVSESERDDALDTQPVQTYVGWGTPPSQGEPRHYSSAPTMDEPTQQHDWAPPTATTPRTETAWSGDSIEPWESREPTAPKRGSLMQWVAVAAVAALIGGGVGAYAASDDDSSTGVFAGSKSATTIAPSQASNSPATPSSIRSVLEKVQPAVVSIAVDGNSGTGSGTGMIITPDGEILTNAHVVRGASKINVTMNGQREAKSAKLLGFDSSLDSAVIKLDNASNLPTVQFGDASAIQVGDEVVAIGNALALAGGPSVTTGIVSARDRAIPDDNGARLENLIQTDAAINPGNSGGPLANMAGQVIGMNTAVIRGSQGEFQNIGFSLSMDAIRPALDDLRAGKVAQPAYLGVSTVTLTDDIRQRFGLTPQKGAVIDSVQPNSPADDSGLSRFDVIVNFDGKAVETSEDLVTFVRAKKPNDKVTVTYFRAADQKETTATLAGRPVSG